MSVGEDRRQPEVRSSSGGRGAAALVVLALAWIAFAFAAVAHLPIASDSLLALERVAAMDGPGELFDLRPIYRPLEVSWFFVLDRTGSDQPWVARTLPLLKHLAACIAVHALARELGASRTAAAAGALLFAVAPTTKLLGWVMAHSTQGRTLWVLVGLVAFLRIERGPRAGRPWGRLAALATAMVLGLLQHPSTIELPLICLAWIVLSSKEGALAGLRRSASHGPLLVLCALGAAYVAFTLFVLPERYHVLRSVDALPANVAKGLTCVLPEPLRIAMLDGLRGSDGPVALAVSGLAGLGLLGALAAAFRRGGPGIRLVIVAVGIDLAIPVLTTGVVQRHAYFPFAFVSIGGALALTARPRVAAPVAALVGALWLADSWTDLREQREAGEIVERVVAQCGETRDEVGARRTVVVLELPCGWGREQDVPVFNWGFAEALRRAGVEGRFVPWRTESAGTSTSQKLVEAATLDARLEKMNAVALRFDPETRSLIRLR